MQFCFRLAVLGTNRVIGFVACSLWKDFVKVFDIFIYVQPILLHELLEKYIYTKSFPNFVNHSTKLRYKMITKCFEILRTFVMSEASLPTHTHHRS